ncbi:hypothetical protein [Alcanivorax sp.]|uniref:hypothetical protein n=1 Tax=Alcanivorax sp. TaxID=1872427 RepID=UPI003A932F90
MSDAIREAFEALDQIDRMYLKAEALTRLTAVVRAALQQTAPAVPDVTAAEELASALREIEGTVNRTATSDQFIRHLKQIATDALAAAPKPDHIGDAGKVGPVAWMRSTPETMWGRSLFSSTEQKGWAPLYTRPAKPRNVVQAEALEEFANDMKELAERNRNLKTAGGVFVASQEAEAKAKRLRSNGGE